MERICMVVLATLNCIFSYASLLTQLWESPTQEGRDLHSAWHSPVPQITTNRSRDKTAKEKGSRMWLLLPTREGHAQGHLQSQGLQVKYCHLQRAGLVDVVWAVLPPWL